MHTLRTAIAICWVAFFIGWLVSATTAKASMGRPRKGVRGLTAIVAVLLIHFGHFAGLETRSPVLGAIGAVLFVAGLALAVWARVHLGRNWGMPMTQRAEPELVTSGPYATVRHPIYTGLLLAIVGSSIAINVIGLLLALVLGANFVYSATVEERNMAAAFPSEYPEYRARTKLMLPFLL
jgi:protein-S-isoprenylcysteine O-methyltransferase Ste14